MRPAGRHALHQAIKHSSHAQIKRHQSARRATVTASNPLTIEVHGFEQHPLTLDNDFELSAWMRFYGHVVGIAVGDLALVDQDEVNWVMYDVVTSSGVESAFDAWDLSLGPS